MEQNLGAIERPVDNRDILLGSVQAPASIPASFIPDITWLKRNFQGQTPYCGAHASSHFQAILEHALTPTASQRYTPRYAWTKIKQIDGFPLSAGTDMRSIFKSLTTDGADDFEPLENDILLPATVYADPSVITPDMTANASAKKISSYAFPNTDFESLCQAIYQNKAVLLLIKCDENFWGTNTPTFTTPKYGHFVVAYGYSSDGIYVVDSADPNDAFAFKKIAKQYINSKFILEAGTAIDLPPAQVQALIKQSASVAQQVVASNIPATQKIDILTKILTFLKSLIQ
jgi:hypothetical protein